MLDHNGGSILSWELLAFLGVLATLRWKLV
jgi:hypothetical protein